MRNAIIISLTAHIVVGLVWFRIVKISHVRFVPRDVYTVSLVTPAEARKQVQQAPAPKPEPVAQEKPKEEELAPPPEKPKPKEPPKEVKQTMPAQDEPKSLPSSEANDAGEETDVSTGDIALDKEDFPYAYYLTTIKRKIAAFWHVPTTSSQEMYCVVYFNILQGGVVQSPTIETSSGNLVFDQAALRAVVQANPLPPLPSGFGDDHLGVHFSFAYERK